jgi:hypothetical protein
VPPTCDDHVQNGFEVDVDCGGECSPCADGQMCLHPTDCAGGLCVNNRCASPDLAPPPPVLLLSNPIDSASATERPQAIADFDGDGPVDLIGVALTPFGTSVDVAHGGGDGQFGAFTSSFFLGYDHYAGGMVGRDLNSDGTADLVWTYEYRIGTSWNYTHVTASLFSAGTPTTNDALFVCSRPYYDSQYRCVEEEGYPTHTTVADVNGDERPDIIVVVGWYPTVNDQQAAFYTFLNDGMGGYQRVGPVVVGAGHSLGPATVADVNGDGTADAVFGDDAGHVDVLLGDGTGQFAAQPVVSIPRQGYELVRVADLNGDGRQDLVVTLPTSTPPLTWLLPGNGDGTFGQPVSIITPFSPTSLIVADLDGDGDIDIAMAGYSSVVHVLVNAGAGTFPVSREFAATDQPNISFMDVADVDGDGRPDVVLFDGTTIRTLLNESK